MTSSGAQQVQQVPVGSLFGLPGFTESFEMYDNLTGMATTLQAAAQTPFNPPNSFQKTDIIYWWEFELLLSLAETYSAGTLNISPEAPWNLLQNPKLKLQGQYSSVECQSGFDMALFQSYRPMRGKGQRNTQDLLGNGPVSGWPNSQIPAVNQGGGTMSQTTTSPYTLTNFPMILEWPGGLWLDQYYDLAEDGTLLPNAQGIVAPTPAFVSPQYMAGGSRVVRPQFNYANAGPASNYDQGPLAASAALTATVQTGSVNLNVRRIGVYASENPAEMPPVYNWQYRRSSTQYPVSAVQKIDIPITEYGQLLSVFVRLFDPAAGSNSVGAYYNVANITKCQLVYGSNLLKFDDDSATMHNRFIQQHGFVPPQGTVIWDLLASPKTDILCNDSRVLNTLTNANTHIHLEYNTAMSSQAYAVVGTELFVPVSVS
jgi:hypothetical protein